MADKIDSINISDVISILESNLPEEEQVIRLSALCAGLGEIYQLYEAAASEYLWAGQKTQAFEYLLKAAQRAHQVYRNNQAFEFYTKILELLKELPDEYRQDAAKIEEAAGDVAGQLAKYELAVGHYMVALEVVQSKEEQAVCHRKLGELYEKQADYEHALSYFQKGLHLLSDTHSTEHARIYMASE